MAEVVTDATVLQSAAKLMPDGSPFVMVNLLRYREVADYGKGIDVPFHSGREAYYRGYAEPTFEIIRRLGGELLWFGHVQVPIYVPDGTVWDDVLIVRYPAFDALLKLFDDETYQSNVFHRTAALADTQVFATLRGSEIR